MLSMGPGACWELTFQDGRASVIDLGHFPELGPFTDVLQECPTAPLLLSAQLWRFCVRLERSSSSSAPPQDPPAQEQPSSTFPPPGASHPCNSQPSPGAIPLASGPSVGTGHLPAQRGDPYLTEGGGWRGAGGRRRGRRDRHPGGSGCSVLGAGLGIHACGKGGSGQGTQGKPVVKHSPGELYWCPVPGAPAEISWSCSPRLSRHPGAAGPRGGSQHIPTPNPQGSHSACSQNPGYV